MKEEKIQLQPINNTYFKNSGGNSNYNLLDNLPQINGVTLKGNKNTSELNIKEITKTSELTNDSGFITADVNSLVNYYDKEEIDNKFHNEVQIKGWTTITANVEEELDIRPQLNNGFKRFTILVYLRKGNIRQGVKYELTAPELEKIGSKVQKNMVCITRSCINPNGDNSMCTLKQCVTAKQDENTNPIFGYMKIKYQLYDYLGNIINGLDNFEWCMYAE